jgi:hypothetical protein
MQIGNPRELVHAGFIENSGHFKPGEDPRRNMLGPYTAEQVQVLKDVRGLGPKAKERLESMLDAPDLLIQIRAVELVLAYTIGKPKQPKDDSGADVREHLRAIFTALRSKLQPDVYLELVKTLAEAEGIRDE